MKKNGRKYRKIQREKAEWKKNHPRKVGEPFSKVRKVPQVQQECRHYMLSRVRIHSSFPPRSVSPNFFLQKISNTECKCLVCGKRYPIEKMEEVKREMLRQIIGETILIS